MDTFFITLWNGKMKGSFLLYLKLLFPNKLKNNNLKQQ